MDDDYIWCNDDRRVMDATDAINLCSEVILDCEGQDLGTEGGSLSVISFRTLGPGVPKTYLIDALTLGKYSLSPVFDIIQSSSLTKIMFDGRMDYTELFHGYGISIRNVLDLQLADIYSRSQRGEDEEDQLRRLSPYLRRGEVAGNSNCYTQVQKLSSLYQCISEHKVGSETQGDNTTVNHTLWLKRPLSEHYLRYAVRDVCSIGLLYDHFKNEGYITSRLSEQSDRYLAIWQDAKPKATDQYKHHGLLPLQILDHTSYTPHKACICCKRNLPRAAYSNAGWGKLTQRRCWVCRAIYVKFVVQARHDDYDDYDTYEGNESDDDYYGGNGF